MSRQASRIGAALFAVTLAFAQFPAAQAAPAAERVASLGGKIQQQQAQIEATRKRLAEKRDLLRFQKRRAQDLQAQLAETNGSIAHATRVLDEISGEVRQNQRKIAWNEVQLRAAQATLARHNDALKRRLVDAYERGDLGYLNVLFSSTSFNNFVERWDDIRYLIAANQRTVRERRSAEHAVAAAERRLEGERATLQDALHRQQQERYALGSLAYQRTQLVAAAEANRRSVAREVAQLEDLSASEEANLEALIRQRQREEAARIAAERRAARLAGRESPQASNGSAPGAFGWPASGPITSPFGMRMDPVGHTGTYMHNGIDIGAPMGATITASATGRVIFAGWYGGYGNAIIIDHGGNASTLYGHCSQIFVANGQDVQRGQAIGAVGMTGHATGPHVHFEIRINGTPVDPAGRLR